MTQQPEALRLADAIDPFVRQAAPDHLTSKIAAAELRGLHQSEHEGWRYAKELEAEAASLREQNDYQDKKLAEMEAALGQALEALENVRRYDKENLYGLDDDIIALRERLARQEQQCSHGIDQKECGWCGPAREEPTRAEKMREAGYTRRPSLREFPSDKPVRQEQERPTFAEWTSDYVQDNLHKLKPEQKPVACGCGGWKYCAFCGGSGNTNLYTAPQPRQWVGLTEEEIVQTLGNVRERLDGNVFGAFGRALEAKLKEKNT